MGYRVKYEGQTVTDGMSFKGATRLATEMNGEAGSQGQQPKYEVSLNSEDGREERDEDGGVDVRGHARRRWF
ncbi:MAG: hypothetical protein KME45_03110 [Stenomitos rutilans HA7619-LM2]|nr:hypothetical protein [Stenomitos rutilans HA7619-LM2]MBW4469374.1 hypothetical protein [Stenomitos rutilans HA7619-LM2]